MTKFVNSSTLAGLHNHKVGQYRIIRKITAMNALALVLVVIVSLFIGQSDDGLSYEVDSRIILQSQVKPSFSNATNRPALFVASDFPIGYVGRIRVVRDLFDPIIDSVGTPGLSIPTPDVLCSFDYIEGGSGELSTDFDFGLPDSPPLWTYRSRGIPNGVGNETVDLPTMNRQAHAMLQSPAIPDRAYLADDTAIVEGWLTLHTYGRMSFELVSEKPPGQGFGAAVQTAVERGQCIPATDLQDNRITVRVRYRCLFFHGALPSVSVGNVVSARVRKEER